MKRFAIYLSVVLTGCATNYPLSESNPKQLTVNVSSSVEKTYRQMLQFSTENCTWLAADAQYYPESKEGDIILVRRLNDGGIKFTFAKFEIKASATGSTALITYRGNMEKFGGASEAWAKGIAAPCPY